MCGDLRLLRHERVETRGEGGLLHCCLRVLLRQCGRHHLDRGPGARGAHLRRRGGLGRLLRCLRHRLRGRVRRGKRRRVLGLFRRGLCRSLSGGCRHLGLLDRMFATGEHGVDGRRRRRAGLRGTGDRSRGLLARLTPPAIQGYLNAMLGRGLSRSTVHQTYRTLNTALATAMQWGLLLRNPCEYVKPPHGSRRSSAIWDEEQTHIFLAEARRSSRYYRLYLTIVLTGMRPGEALALRWSDVDLTLGVVVVSQKFYRLGGRQIWGETKTHKENTVTIPPALVEELTRLRREQAEHRKLLGAAYQDRGLVFCQPNGKPLNAHNISQRDFKGLVTGLKLPRIRLYDLRGCHATYLADQGTPVHIIQSRLGHSSPEVALKYYIRARAKFQREAADRLAERLLADAPDAENSGE